MFSGKLKKCVNIVDPRPVYMKVGDPRWWGNPAVHIISHMVSSSIL